MYFIYFQHILKKKGNYFSLLSSIHSTRANFERNFLADLWMFRPCKCSANWGKFADTSQIQSGRTIGFINMHGCIIIYFFVCLFLAGVIMDTVNWGNGSTNQGLIPCQLSAGISGCRIAQIACGSHHTLVLTDRGEVSSCSSTTMYDWDCKTLRIYKGDPRPRISFLCNGILIHGAQVGGLWVFTGHICINKCKTNASMIFIMLCGVLHMFIFKTAVDAGDIRTWWTMVIFITGRTWRPPSLSHMPG